MSFSPRACHCINEDLTRWLARSLGTRVGDARVCVHCVGLVHTPARYFPCIQRSHGKEEEERERLNVGARGSERESERGIRERAPHHVEGRDEVAYLHTGAEEASTTHAICVPIPTDTLDRYIQPRCSLRPLSATRQSVPRHERSVRHFALRAS